MPSVETAWREFQSILLASAENPKLFALFLDDFLTAEERRAISFRWQIMKQLSRGVSQRQIAKDLGVGIATVTRGTRLFLNPKGACSTILDMTTTKKTHTGRTASWRKQLKAKKP